jgi:hypothetical protein
MTEFTSNWLARLSKALFQFFNLTSGAPVTFDANGQLRTYNAVAGVKASYAKTATGAQTLLASSGVDRELQILVTVNETFAQSTGTRSSFDIGETGATHKFKQSLNTGTAGDKIQYDGTLSAGKTLLVTATAATGDGTGGIDVSAVAIPILS